MFISIINDCRDENAFGRQSVRAASLFGQTPFCLGVKSDLEAAGNLIDLLDASQGSEGIILVNVAPRHGSAKRWPNGTPFGFFWYKKTLVCTSLGGQTLSLAKKFGLLDQLFQFDIPTVAEWAATQNLLTAEQANIMKDTQFRSFEFLPRAAKWVWDKQSIPHAPFAASEVPEPQNPIWWTDCFGNVKTTFQEKDLAEATRWIRQDVPFYPRLKDVPNGTFAWTLGSSGLGDARFLELVVQGGKAREKIAETLANAPQTQDNVPSK